jgi:GT2 family glycosyltransferase
MLSVSVVILTQGTRNEDLHHIWADVLGQSLKPQNFVTVVNCETVDLGQVPAGVKVVETGVNLGIPAGRNYGVRGLASTPGQESDLILFIDDDAYILGTDFIERAIQIFEANDKLGLVQPKVVTRIGQSDETQESGPRYWIPRADKTPTLESFPAFSVWEGATVIRWHCFIEANGWAEPIFYAHEGTDLAWRVWNTGFETRYEPRLVVSHPPVGPERHDKSIWFGMRNKVVMARRNLPLPFLVIYPLAWFALDFVKILIGKIPHPSGKYAIKTQLRELFKGFFAGMRMDLSDQGYVFDAEAVRRKLSWKTIRIMTKHGRPPLI